jgi:hypothetical protein
VPGGENFVAHRRTLQNALWALGGGAVNFGMDLRRRLAA